ncbi:MAG: glycosyltransferase family 4 protein [Tahibacter sp.]
MNVLFLTKYPIDGASSRYRVYQYLPYLDAAGIRYRVQSFMSPAMYRLMNLPGHNVAKVIHATIAALRRLAQLIRCRRYDLIFLQRECLPFGAPYMERIFRRCGVPLLFDYDDALFIVKPNTHAALLDFFKRPDRVVKIFRIVDCVLAGNDWLRDRAAEYCADARTFHVAEDLKRYTNRPPHREHAAVVLGWLGSPSTEKYLNQIREPLRALNRRYPALRFKIIGGGQFADPDIRIEHVPWTLDSELTQLHSFDIGLMPLPWEDWSLGKSGGKARTYMAVGLPAVCTAIGFNNELIRDGETGFLVQQSDAWESVLSRLIESADLRGRIGDAARRDVEARFSLEKLGPRFVQILREVGAHGVDA